MEREGEDLMEKCSGFGRVEGKAALLYATLCPRVDVILQSMDIFNRILRCHRHYRMHEFSIGQKGNINGVHTNDTAEDL